MNVLCASKLQCFDGLVCMISGELQMRTVSGELQMRTVSGELPDENSYNPSVL